MIWITAMSPFFPKCRLTLTVQAARQQKSFLFAKKGTIEKFFLMVRVFPFWII